MPDYIIYYDGICNPALPNQHAYQSYAESTGKFTQWNRDGSVAIAATPMTAPQLALVAAWDAASAAAATLATNQQTVQANVQANLATLQAWIAAHPSGAVLTAAQTLVLAEMLVGLYKLAEQDFASTTGT